jgi:HNH endonuclease
MNQKRCSREKPPHKTINGKKQSISRWVMEEHLGRPLETYEHVYHKDGDVKNNDIDNLVIIFKKSQ